MNIYIASPFFNDEQKEIVESIEAAILESGNTFYSPMRHSILRFMSPEERAASAQRIFDENIKHIDDANLVVAMTDDFDPGTVFEMGHAHGRGIDSITYSPANHGANVMLSKSSKGHFVDINVLTKALQLNVYHTGERETVE